MKKLKYLTLLSLSMLLLTSCGDTVHRSIEREISIYGVDINDQAEQTAMIEQVASGTLASRADNSHVIAIDVEISQFGLIETGVAGYGYYKYNSANDTVTFNLDTSGRSTLKVDLDAEQKLDVNFKILNFNIFEQKDIQLQFDSKPLNELFDLKFISEIDKSVIKRYRKSQRGIDISLDNSYDAYIFDLDADYINQQLNNETLKFNSDVVISFLSELSSVQISIIHLTGSVLINNSISADVKIFLYNLKP
jgi:hypothetical protein